MNVRVKLGLDKTELATLSAVSVDSIRKAEGGRLLKEETIYRIYNALLHECKKKELSIKEESLQIKKV